MVGKSNTKILTARLLLFYYAFLFRVSVVLMVQIGTNKTLTGKILKRQKIKSASICACLKQPKILSSKVINTRPEVKTLKRNKVIKTHLLPLICLHLRIIVKTGILLEN